MEFSTDQAERSWIMDLQHLLKERKPAPHGGLWYVHHQEWAPGYGAADRVEKVLEDDCRRANRRWKALTIGRRPVWVPAAVAALCVSIVALLVTLWK